VIAALATTETVKVDGEWIVKHLPELIRRKIPIDLGLVEMRSANLSGRIAELHPEARIEHFSTADDWLTHLMNELRSGGTSS
jgi:hypothetical protein